MKILGMECSDCSDCSHENVKQEDRQLICQDCGLVLGENLTSEYQSKPNYLNRDPSWGQERNSHPILNRIADWIAWKLAGRAGRKFRKKKGK